MYEYWFGCIPLQDSSRAEIAVKLKQIQNFHVVSRPEFPVLSNGAHVFGVNIMYRKMEETLHGNCACTQLQFKASM
jgi:hypothetical protein